MTFRDFNGRILTGHTHQLVWMPNRNLIGRLFVLAVLGGFCWLLIWGPQ